MLDLTDDRLADVLRMLSDDTNWTNFERRLTGTLLRVYDLLARETLERTPGRGKEDEILFLMEGGDDSIP